MEVGNPENVDRVIPHSSETMGTNNVPVHARLRVPRFSSHECMGQRLMSRRLRLGREIDGLESGND